MRRLYGGSGRAMDADYSDDDYSDDYAEGEYDARAAAQDLPYNQYGIPWKDPNRRK